MKSILITRLLRFQGQTCYGKEIQVNIFPDLTVKIDMTYLRTYFVKRIIMQVYNQLRGYKSDYRG